jgi:hypothetical protein
VSRLSTLGSSLLQCRSIFAIQIIFKAPGALEDTLFKMSLPNTSSDTAAAGLDEATLVDQLNDMLSSLNLPLNLISPTDLTPSLLIAILESILAVRIPLVDRNKESKRSRASKIQNMKIFLGVLETDILKADVGLSDVDPRRLADGEWDEVFFIAELLCWIGRKMGFIQRHKAAAQLNKPGPSNASTSTKIHGAVPHQSPRMPLSPKTQLDLDAESLFQGGSTVTGSLRRSEGTVSPFFKGSSDSNTSLFSGDHEGESEDEDGYSDGVSDILGGLSPLITSQPTLPQCIHNPPSPLDSLLMSVDLGSSPSHPPPDNPKGRASSSSLQPSYRAHGGNSDLADSFRIEHDHVGSSMRSPVRYSGFIEPVDEDFELESFQNSRSVSLSSSTLGNTVSSTLLNGI